MDDLEFVEDLEEEGARGDEQQNRTFIILVAVMGGLLLVGIVAFCAWAILFSQRMLGGGGGEATAGIAATQTIDAAMAISGLTATADAVQIETAEPPTATPQPPAPTPTPTVAAAAGPTRVPPTATPPAGTPGGGAVPAASPTAPSGAAAQPTATATAQPPRELSETGLETSTVIILAAVFLFILIMARRLRTVQ